MVSVPARRQQVAYGRELGLSARRACIAVLGSAINVEVSQPQGDEGCARGRADDRVVGAVSPLRVSAHPYLVVELMDFGLKLLDACAQTDDFIHLAFGLGRPHARGPLQRHLLLALGRDLVALRLTGRLAAALGVLAREDVGNFPTCFEIAAHGTDGPSAPSTNWASNPTKKKSNQDSSMRRPCNSSPAQITSGSDYSGARI